MARMSLAVSWILLLAGLAAVYLMNDGYVTTVACS